MIIRSIELAIIEIRHIQGTGHSAKSRTKKHKLQTISNHFLSLFFLFFPFSLALQAWIYIYLRILNALLYRLKLPFSSKHNTQASLMLSVVRFPHTFKPHLTSNYAIIHSRIFFKNNFKCAKKEEILFGNIFFFDFPIFQSIFGSITAKDMKKYFFFFSALKSNNKYI